MPHRTLAIAIAAGLLIVLLALTVSAGAAGIASPSGNMSLRGAERRGNLEPPGPPGTTTSYTLVDIYNRLETGAGGAPSTWTEPASGPGTPSGHTLDEIMAIAPQADNANGVQPMYVLNGKTYWSLRTDGTWGLQTGTMPDNGAVHIVPTTTNQAIPTGFHMGFGYVVGDAGLIPGNIRAGITLFDVAGDPNVVDTSSGNATAADLRQNKTAWVDGLEITGSQVPGSVPRTGQTISQTVHDDGDLQKGLPWPSPRFITGTTGIVTDTLTGLVWLARGDCGDIMVWAQAVMFGGALFDGWTGDGAGGDCGLSDGSGPGDWRLPNVRELHSLIDYGYAGLALPNTAGTGQMQPGDPFTAVLPIGYWSSTTSASLPNRAWYVGMAGGDIVYSLKDVSLAIWPVRDPR